MSSRSLPRSIFLFGLLNTALGSLGLTSGVRALFRPQQAIQVYQQVDASTQSLEWLHLAMLISPFSFAVMLVSGIALIRKQAWGRTLAIYYGLAWVAYSLIFRGINIFRVLDKVNNPLALNAIFGWVLTGLLVLGYGSLMLYTLARPKVKEALANYQPGAEIIEFPLERRD